MTFFNKAIYLSYNFIFVVVFGQLFNLQYKIKYLLIVNIVFTLQIMCFLIHLVRRAHQLEVGDNKIKTNEGKFRSTLIFKE